MSDEESATCTEEHFALLDQVSPRLSPRGRRSMSPRTALTQPPEALAEMLPQSSGSQSIVKDEPLEASIASEHQSAHAPRRSNRASSTNTNGVRTLYRFQSVHAINDDERRDASGDHLQTFWIDHSTTDSATRAEDVYGPVFGAAIRSRPNRVRLLVHYINLGVVGVVCCLVLLTIGLVFRLEAGESATQHRDAGRFLLSAGVFGLASALSNFVAVKVLLLTMFLSRHEAVLQNSVRDIVMNIFFSKERLEEQIVAHIRKAVSTTSLAQSVQVLVTHERCKVLVDRYLEQFLHYTTEGMQLSLMGVSKAKLEPLLIPAVLSVVSDVAPVLSEVLLPKDVITMDALHEVMERVVSHRTASLDIQDLKGIVSGVLEPHLSILVLWGSLFGILLGVIAEVFAFSHFLSPCISTS